MKQDFTYHITAFFSISMMVFVANEIAMHCQWNTVLKKLQDKKPNTPARPNSLFTTTTLQAYFDLCLTFHLVIHQLPVFIQSFSSLIVPSQPMSVIKSSLPADFRNSLLTAARFARHLKLLISLPELAHLWTLYKCLQYYYYY